MLKYDDSLSEVFPLSASKFQAIRLDLCGHHICPSIFFTSRRSGVCGMIFLASQLLSPLCAGRVSDQHRSYHLSFFFDKQPPRLFLNRTFRKTLPPQTSLLGRPRLPYATQPLAAYGFQPPPPWLPPVTCGRTPKMALRSKGLVADFAGWRSIRRG